MLLVSGLPGADKSALAGPIAEALVFALLSKAHVGRENRSGSRRNGDARRVASRLRLLVDHPALHHERHVFDRGDVFGRVTLHRDDVSVEAFA